MTITIEEFCAKHDACTDGREWAMATGCTTMSELWQRDDIRPDWRVWISTRPGVLGDKDLRLFSCWCVRQVWHLLTDERSHNAVEASERYAHGEATADELARAGEAAWAARDAAWAAWAAGEDAWTVWTVWNARNAARRAAEEDALVAARGAAGAAVDALATWAALEAAQEAAKAAQAEYLRTIQPNFDKGA